MSIVLLQTGDGSPSFLGGITDADVITEAQGLTRQNTGITTATYAAWLNRIQRSYARRNNWPELRVLGATVTTTANQAYAVLPTNFDRFSGNTILYNPTAITGGYQGGYTLPILTSGDSLLDGGVAAWRPIGSGTPVAATLSGAAGAYRLYLYPLPDTGSKTIVLDYYRAPSVLDGSGIAFDLQALTDCFTNELCRQIMVFLGGRDNLEQAAFFTAEARKEYNMVLRNLLTA